MKDRGKALEYFWLKPLYFFYLLLPILFQTLMGFQSGMRAGWEALYLVLAVVGAVYLRLCEPEGQGGVWRPFYAAAAGAAALFCQSPLLGGCLFVLAVTFCFGGKAPFTLQFLAGAAVFLLGGLVSLNLLLYAVFGNLGRPRFETYVPGDSRHTYAIVTVTDPGAMGRTRYHAVEQFELLDLGNLGRISVVMGRSSGTYGDGKYAYVIDAYFNQE